MSSEDNSPTDISHPKNNGCLTNVEDQNLSLPSLSSAEDDQSGLHSNMEAQLEVSQYGNFLNAIESMFDEKFNRFEQRLNEVIEKNDAFTTNVTDLLKKQIESTSVVKPTKLKSDKDETKEFDEDDVIVSKNFMNSVENKLLKISDSIERYERQQEEYSEKIADLCNKCVSLETGLQTLEEIQELTPKVISIEKDLHKMLNCENDANDVVDKMIPKIYRIQEDITIIGKDVCKVQKQQDMDYRKIKDEVLFNMQMAIDETYGKICDNKDLTRELFDVTSKKTDDLKRNGRELFENTEETLERIKKVEKSLEETSRILSKPGVNSNLIEHSPSPSKNAIKKECDSVIIDIDNAISSNNAKLTNIESRLSEVMDEMRKRNDSNHIDCNSIPSIHSLNNDFTPTKSDVSSRHKESNNFREDMINKQRVKSSRKDSLKQDRKKSSSKFSASSEDLQTLMNKVESLPPITKWTVDDIPSINIKDKPRKRNSSTCSSSSSSDEGKDNNRSLKSSRNKRKLSQNSRGSTSRSKLKSSLNVGLKKRRFASTEGTSSSDDSTSTLAEHLTNASMARQVTKMSVAVERIQEKLDAFIRQPRTDFVTPESLLSLNDKHTNQSKSFDLLPSNQTYTSSDTVRHLERLSDKIERNLTQNTAFEKEIKKIFQLNIGIEELMRKMQETDRQSKEQCKEIESLKTILRDGSNANDAKVDEVLQRMKAVQPNNPLMNESVVGKLDEILQKIRSTHKCTNQYKETSLSMMTVLMEAKQQATDNYKVLTNPGSSNSNESISSILKSMLPKIQQLADKAVPALDEIRKAQRQANEQLRLEEESTKCQLETIRSIVQDVRENKSKKDVTSNAQEQQMSLIDNNNALQMFNALNDLKEQLNDRDQTMSSVLNELKLDIGTIHPKLNESIKTKSSSESSNKEICSIVEEIKENQLADMKTFSGINTMLQGIKASDNKIAAQIKDLKGSFKSGSGDDSTKYSRSLKDLEIRHDLALENMKLAQRDGFDEMKGLLNLVSKAMEKVSKDCESVLLLKNNQKYSYDLSIMQTRLSQLVSNHDNLTEDIKKSFQDQSKLIKSLLTKLSEKEKSLSKSIPQKSRKSEDDQLNRLKKDFEKLEHSLISTFNETSNKIVEELEKLKEDEIAHSEILNSVEDLKLLTSSTPNAVHDLIPQIEKISSDISKIPDDIGGYTAGLEENLCANLEARIKDIHLQSLNHIDNRLQVIKKYVKYGQNPGSLERQNSVELEQDASTTSRTSSIESNYSNSSSSLNQTELVNAIGRDSKRIFDQSLKNFKSDIEGMIESKIGEICSIEKQILNEQAKAIVIEEQFEELAKLVLEPILELKSSQSDIPSKPTIEQMEERLMEKLEENAVILQDIRSISDIASSYGPVLAENQHAMQLVSRLVKHLMHVQKMQEEILKQGDKSIEYQSATNHIYETLVPTLEEIQTYFKDVQNPEINFDEIPELTKKLLTKINSLNDLETRLLASPRLSNSEDLSQLIITCLTVLDNLVASVNEEPSSAQTKSNKIKIKECKSSEAIKDLQNKEKTKNKVDRMNRTDSSVPTKKTVSTKKSSKPSKRSHSIDDVFKSTKEDASSSNTKSFDLKPNSKLSRKCKGDSESNYTSDNSGKFSSIELDSQSNLAYNSELSASSQVARNKTSSKRQKRNRRTSSSADDSGCGDTAGSLSTIKSPTVLSASHLSPDFENEQNEKDDFPKIIDVKGSSLKSSTISTNDISESWRPKRRRTSDEEDQEDDDGSGIESIDHRETMSTENNVSEDEAKKPKWQPKVVVTKDLSDTEMKEMAKLDKPSSSICSSTSPFSISSIHTPDEKETIKIKY